MPDATFEVTVNGVPLRKVIAEETRVEANHHRSEEIGILSRQTRSHISTNRISNHSGSRTSRGRVICANGVYL